MAKNIKQNSQAFFDSIFEQSPFSMWISDEKGTLIKQNQACRDTWGITDNDVVGKYNLFKDPKVKKLNLTKILQNVFKKGKTTRFQIQYDAKTFNNLTGAKLKNQVIIEATVSPVKDKNGQVVNALVIHKDITEKIQTDHELKKHRLYLTKLVKERTRKLEDALDDIKVLKGLIPVCSFCKKIRDDSGYWNRLEEYISKHTDANISHSICPECAKEHYPEIFNEK